MVIVIVILMKNGKHDNKDNMKITMTMIIATMTIMITMTKWSTEPSQ